MTFICKNITVNCSEEGIPCEFLWQGKEYRIVKVEKRWQDYGLPPSGSPKRQTWRLRRHRNYYRIATVEGRKFEIYLDRGSKGARTEWVLARELSVL